MSSARNSSLPSGNSPNDQQRLFAGSDNLWQRRVRRFVRQVFFVGKKTKKRAALQSPVVPNRSA